MSGGGGILGRGSVCVYVGGGGVRERDTRKRRAIHRGKARERDTIKREAAGALSLTVEPQRGSPTLVLRLGRESGSMTSAMGVACWYFCSTC